MVTSEVGTSRTWPNCHHMSAIGGIAESGKPSAAALASVRVRVSGLFEFLCGVSHRQAMQRCATVAHQYFKAVHDVDVGQLAEARLRLSAPGVRPNAIGERRSESYSAVASSEDGPGMYRPG